MPGRIMTLIGGDGSGKTTFGTRLCSCVDGPTKRIYMGTNPSALTHALPSTRLWISLKRVLGKGLHHAGPPEPGEAHRPRKLVERALRQMKSLIAVAFQVSEELYRLFLAQAYARLGYLVILDRHPYPDYHARHVRGTGGWLRWGDRIHGFLLERVYPRPRGLILLDAPAEVLYSRKREGSLAAVRARRQEYLDMTEAFSDVTIVDVARPEDEVLADLLRIAGDGGRSDGKGSAAPAITDAPTALKHRT